MVVVISIAISFTIRLIVLVFVADHIVQRKAIMGTDEVDAAVGSSTGVLIQIRGAA